MSASAAAVLKVVQGTSRMLAAIEVRVCTRMAKRGMDLRSSSGKRTGESCPLARRRRWRIRVQEERTGVDQGWVSVSDPKPKSLYMTDLRKGER